MDYSKNNTKETGLTGSQRFDIALKAAVAELSQELFKGSLARDITLILTGSLARGEGSFLPDAGGAIRFLGDLEFLLVSASGTSGRALAMEFERALEGRLEECGIDISVDVGYVRPDYFTRLGPHIFAVELKAHAKVLYGDESVLEKIKDFNANDIPRWDALHLLYNRMVEQMMLLDGLLSGGPEDIRKAHYQNIKFTLDVGGSLLAFQRDYRTSYMERTRAVARAVEAIGHGPTRECLSKLPEELKYWTLVKLDPSCDPILSWDADASRTEDNRKAVLKRWLELVRIVHGLWLWEMNNYLGAGWTDDTEILLKRYLRSEGLGMRAHGWAKWVSRLRANGGVPYARLLKLFPVGSPRALIYASTARLYLSLPYLLEEYGPGECKDSIRRIDASKAGELLPALSGAASTDWPSVCGDLVGSWKEHVKNG